MEKLTESQIEALIEAEEEEDSYWLDEDESMLDDCCPYCHRPYDDIDYEL